MNIYDLLAQHSLTIRDVSEKYEISRSTLSDVFRRPVDTWSVGVLRATASQLDLGLDELVVELERKKELRPFIKWVGGKRQLLSAIDELVPEHYNRYFEPFLGGGALLLHLQPKDAVINDFNSELINAWEQVRDDTSALQHILTQHQENNSKEYYLDLRLADRDGRIDGFTDTERAARFIYMIKVGFNGLWRENKAGQNNVPYGKYKNPTINDPIIPEVAKYLNEAKIKMMTGDYHLALKSAKRGDFVYLDSPYDVVSSTASFTGYTADGFSHDDQSELARVYADLTKKGVMVLASNSDTDFVNDIYGNIEGVTLHKVSARRSINSNAKKRGPVGEVLITNY
jgi:DNA adenine methylase